VALGYENCQGRFDDMMLLVDQPATAPAADTRCRASEPAADTDADIGDSATHSESKSFEVYGDSAYTAGAHQGSILRCRQGVKVQTPSTPTPPSGITSAAS
jgi:hypothetical protein